MLAAAGGVAGWRASGARRRAVVVLVAWVVAPVALGVVVSMVRPIIVTRYFIYLIPAIVLLLALGIDAIPARWPRRAVGVAAVALALSGTLGWYGSAPRPDWRAATAYLLANGAPADRSIFVGDWGRVVVHYARQVGRADDLPLKLWRGLDFSSPAVARVVEATAAAMAAEGRDLWLVVADDASPDPASDPRLAGLWRHYAVAEMTAFDLVVLYRARPLDGG
jgi:hypothetical protein